MRVAVGCDHRGLSLKEFIIKLLTEATHSYQDFGGDTTEPVDYPDIAQSVGDAVAKGDCQCGILICDTGIGMSIAANKVKGIRAALCHDVVSAQRARQHNDANVLCLAARRGQEQMPEIVAAFLTTEFAGERHLRRVNKIKAMES